MTVDQPDNQEKPKIIVDDDWKQQAQAEKQRLAEATKQQEQKEQKEAGTAAATDRLPQADFPTLVSSFMTQALFALGMIDHPTAGKEVNLDLAKFNVDMLEVLDQKTRGNLTAQEKTMLDQALHQVRMAFVEVASRQGPIG